MGGEVMESSYDAELAFLGADGSLRGPSLRGCRVNFGSLLRVAGGYPAEVEEAGQKNFLYLLTISSVFKRNFRTAELTRKLTLVPASRPAEPAETARFFFALRREMDVRPARTPLGPAARSQCRAGAFLHAAQFPRTACGGFAWPSRKTRQGIA